MQAEGRTSEAEAFESTCMGIEENLLALLQSINADAVTTKAAEFEKTTDGFIAEVIAARNKDIKTAPVAAAKERPTGFAKLPKETDEQKVLRSLSIEQKKRILESLGVVERTSKTIQMRMFQLDMIRRICEEALRQTEEPKTFLGRAAATGTSLREKLGMSTPIKDMQTKQRAEITQFLEKDYSMIAVELMKGEKTFQQIASEFPLIGRVTRKYALNLSDPKNPEDVLSQYNVVFSVLRGMKNYEEASSLATDLLKLEARQVNIDFPTTDYLLHKARKDTDALVIKYQEGWRRPSKEMIAKGAKPMTDEQIVSYANTLFKERRNLLLDQEAMKRVDPAKLRGAKKNIYAQYNDMEDPNGEWSNLKDTTWDTVYEEVAINAPLIMASGGAASLARAGLTMGGRALAGRVLAREMIKAGAEITAKELVMVGAEGIAEWTGKNLAKKGMFAASGLLVEGTAFEIAHLGLQGEWIGKMPDWGSRILWSTATLGAFHGSGKASERLFTKKILQNGQMVTEDVLLGRYVAGISNKAVQETAKQLIAKGHIEAACMMVVGAAQNLAYNGNIDEFIEHFGDELLHSYISVGSLKIAHGTIEIVKATTKTEMARKDSEKAEQKARTLAETDPFSDQYLGPTEGSDSGGVDKPGGIVLKPESRIRAISDDPFSDKNYEFEKEREERGNKVRTLYESGDPIIELRSNPVKDPYVLREHLEYVYLLEQRAKNSKELIELFELLQKFPEGEDWLHEDWKKSLSDCIDRRLSSNTGEMGNFDVGNAIVSIELQEHFGIKVSDKTQQTAEEHFHQFCVAKPQHAVRFVRAFNVSSKQIMESRNGLIHSIDAYRELERAGLIHLSDQELHEGAILAISICLKFGARRSQSVEHALKLQSEFNIPKSDVMQETFAGVRHTLEINPELARSYIETLVEKGFATREQIEGNVLSYLDEHIGKEKSDKLLTICSLVFPENSRQQCRDFGVKQYLEILRTKDVVSLTKWLNFFDKLQIADRPDIQAAMPEIVTSIIGEEQIEFTGRGGGKAYMGMRSIFFLKERHRIPDAEFIEPLRRGLMRLVERSDLAGIKQLRDACEDKYDIDQFLQEPEYRAAATEQMQSDLRFGLFDTADKKRDFFALDAEFASEATRNAALEGAVHLYGKGQIGAMLDFAKSMKIRESDLSRKIHTELDSGILSISPLVENIHSMPDNLLMQLDAKYYLNTYRKDIGINSTKIYEEFVRVRKDKGVTSARGFAAEVRGRRDAMISSKKQDSSMLDEPFYQEIVTATFPPHIDNYSFESSESCKDRSKDLARYSVRENYSFTVKPGSDMQMRNGQSEDAAALTRAESPLRKAGYSEQLGNDTQKAKQALEERLADCTQKVSLEDCCKTEEEQLFGLFLRTMTGEMQSSDMCDLLVAYHLAHAPHVEQYMQGTRGNIEKAKNKRYQYLLELHEFYGDRMKDATRVIYEKALENPEVRALLPKTFETIAFQKEKALKQEQKSRLRMDKLGLSVDFFKQWKKVMQKERGTSCSDGEARALIREYEDSDAGATRNPALEGLLQKQRKDTLAALRVLQGPDAILPKHLEDVDLKGEQMGSSASKESYDETKFLALLSEDTKQVIESPLKNVDDELGKYEAVDSGTSTKDKRQRRVEAYITKNHTSAHARGVAGVCVNADNPSEHGEESMWDRQNYLQLVLRDADTKVCQGCVLMYVEEIGGKKILTASMNPSSTYLFSVNESEMFQEITNQLVSFAKENKIDAVGVYQNPNMRTNRTGGIFEKAMDEAIATLGRQCRFSEPRFFSNYANGAYRQEIIDLLWAENPEEFEGVKPQGESHQTP
ncbi:MAG: hypothetical protein FJZ64_00290 [Chlamydiae bacterium]|nr:hypothetical protein [Chlamydiota bacterium]